MAAGRNHKLIIVLAVFTSIFIYLADRAKNIAYFSYDPLLSKSIQIWLDGHITTWQGLAYFISFFGVTGVAAVMIIFTALIFAWFKMRREALFIILTPLASLINYFVKIMVNRPRPSSDLVKVIDRQFDASFPSGHTVFYTVFLGFIIILLWRHRELNRILRLLIMIISALLIVLISIARISLGAHWASDVIGGYLLGLICLMTIVRIYQNKKHPQ